MVQTILFILGTSIPSVPEVRILYSPTATKFSKWTIVLHGCNPWSGWSKLDFSRFQNPREDTLYVFPMSSEKMACVEGTRVYFSSHSIQDFQSLVEAGLPRLTPPRDPKAAVEVAAHSGAQKILTWIDSKNPGQVETYTLVDATYLNGFFTQPASFEADFRAFANLNQKRIQCVFSTLATGLPQTQTTAQGCQEICLDPARKPAGCALYLPRPVDHMGLFYESFGNYF